MKTILEETPDRKIYYGHVRLIRVERDEAGKQVYTYQCRCEKEWQSPKRSFRLWSCGDLECPFVSERTKRLANPRRPGRPSNIEKGKQAPGRITFYLPSNLREEFDSACLARRSCMSDELREMVEAWLYANRMQLKEEQAKKSKEERGLERRRTIERFS